MKLAQKKILVTGGASGIGRELVLGLLRRGAQVIAVDRNQAALEETRSLAVQAAPGQLELLCLDLTDRSAIVAALGEQGLTKWGPIDGVINCAGVIQHFVRVKDLSLEEMERVFAINWWGPLLLIRALLPHLLTRPSAHIVNVSSMGGFLPVPGQAIYGASKAALKLFTEALYAELQGSPVRVTVVYPGAIATPIAANSGVQIQSSGSSQKQYRAYAADRAAKDILDAVERDAFRVLVGRDAKLMDLLCRLSPRRATEFIARQMRDLLA